MMPTEPHPLTQKTIAGPPGDGGPHLLITAGVHGDEFEPMAAVRRLAQTLDARQLSGRVTLVPIVNEPAFRRGTRTADDGLDLARTCPGRPDGSITERIAHALTGLIQSADYYIDLHTGGVLFEIVPLAGYMLHRDARVLDAQRRMAKAFDLPLVWGTTPALEGRSLSVARDANVPAIYVEHGGGGGGCDPAKVDDLAAGCLNVMSSLGILREARPAAAASRVQHVVEDDREQSGHLQINHPAPSPGFFEPAVTLGQMIERGQPLGDIVDPLGGATVTVKASHAGIVVVLRSLPSVKTGDSLATVVELRGETRESDER
jgi:predicted deacylase